MARGPTPRAPRLVGRALRLGDRELPLYSGAAHYWRLERAAWRPALTAVRDLGLSLVETYVPWQVHELAPGRYDFGEIDPKKDLGAFLDLAQELELGVFLRPGPHINAEMTYFGLPERIVFDRACQARSPKQNPVLQVFPPRFFPVPSYASDTFFEEAARFFRAVGEIASPRRWPDGPVVMLQVDNEGAFYFRDAAYDQDYHPDALRRWRAYLEEKYGSLDGLAEAHRTDPARSWDDVGAPVRFDAKEPSGLPRHLDWAHFRESLVTEAMGRFKAALDDAGLDGLPTVHNLPLGDQGMSPSPPGLSEVVDLVGFDYYHARREHRAIKRRTLYLAGTSPLPYSPEMGAGAPPWFTPLAKEDSLFTLMVALAYGLRGFNLYMAVDRDRWYGAPIDHTGRPRVEAGLWRRLMKALDELAFHRLRRRVEVGLMLPREYGRLSRVTSMLGFFSPLVLEATGSSPVEACAEDDLGFGGPVQILWWRWVARMNDALTAAGIPFVTVDGDAKPERLASLRAVLTPSFEFCDPDRWRTLTAFSEGGGTVLYGPAMPSLDLRMRRQPFEVPKHGRRVSIDEDRDAARAVESLGRELELGRPFPVTPAPLETTVHEDERGPRVLFVMNPAKDRRGATVGLPAPVVAHDVMSGERFDGRRHLVIPMEGWSCRMLRLERTGEASTSEPPMEGVGK